MADVKEAAERDRRGDAGTFCGSALNAQWLAYGLNLAAFTAINDKARSRFNIATVMQRLVVMLAAFLALGFWPAGAQNADPFHEAPAPLPRVVPKPVPQRPPQALEAQPIVQLSPPPQSALDTRFDGTYIGYESLTPNGGGHCNPGPHLRHVVVKDGRFLYPYDIASREILDGSMDSAGKAMAFSPSSSGGVRLTGQFKGVAFTGVVETPGCSYMIQLRRDD